MPTRLKNAKYYAFGLSLVLHALLLCTYLGERTRAAIEITQERDLVNSQDPIIVSTEKSPNSSRPEKSRLLGERDQQVEKESVARKGGKQPVLPSQTNAPHLSLSDLGLAGTPKERPIFEGTTGTGTSLDVDIPEVQPGTRTLLNTRRYAHWMFMERIREAISPGWRADVQKLVADLQFVGLRLQREQMVSRVAVKLDSKGKLLRVSFLQTSGSEMLDAAAVAAFENAKQFPNPPKALISEEGEVTIHWTFTVKQPQMKLTSAR